MFRMSIVSVAIAPNTIEFERLALVKPTGFREYDARWVFEKEFNLNGIRVVGRAFGTLLHERGVKPQVVTGHDFRSYSGAVKQALIVGLMDAGCTVHDIGLALSPMAILRSTHSTFRRSPWSPRVTMRTVGPASSLEWPPFTLGPDDMADLKDMV